MGVDGLEGDWKCIFLRYNLTMKRVVILAILILSLFLLALLLRDELASAVNPPPPAHIIPHGRGGVGWS